MDDPLLEFYNIMLFVIVLTPQGSFVLLFKCAELYVTFLQDGKLLTWHLKSYSQNGLEFIYRLLAFH